MANQTLVQFRVDSSLKKEVTEIYQALGMDLPTAFRMFMIRSKIEHGLPFPAVLPETNANLSETAENEKLLLEALKRMQNTSGRTLSFQEVLQKCGIKETDLEKIEELEIS